MSLARSKATGVIGRSLDVALRLFGEGKAEAAEEVCRGILKVEPGNAHVLHLLAQFKCRRGGAASAYLPARQAVSLEPGRANFHLTLGVAQLAAGVSAGGSYRRATVLDPEFAEAHLNLGTLLPIRSPASRASWRRAIALRPALAEAHNNLAGAYLALATGAEAIRRYRRALALLPTYGESWNGLASAAAGQGRLRQAAQAAKRALALLPAYPEAMNNYGTVLVGVGDIRPAAAWLRRAVGAQPGYADAGSNLLFALAYDGALSLPLLFAEQRAWAGRHAPRGLPMPAHSNSRDPDRRLKLGYLSADFREHPIAWNVTGLIERHDRRRFEVSLYSRVAAPDPTSRQLQALADRWCDVVDLSQPSLAAKLAADGIDILVLLAAHTAGNRPEVAAHRPAPVQVAFHGIGSTGVDAVGYWLSDPVLHPPDTGERFVETLVRLPCFYLHRPPEPSPDPGPPPHGAAGAITFGSCNNPAKLSPGTIAVWAEVLARVPGARLLLKYVDRFRDALVTDRLLSSFAAHGIDSSRLILEGGQLDRQAQLRLLDRIDIALDPFPFNGSTTSFEALWMGVPVVSLLGDRFVGRVGASLLEQVGLRDLVAANAADYVAIAERLARDAPRLASLRSELRSRVRASPLMDAAAHAEAIEAAYRSMWRHWCTAP
jgi:predicted O-linked N-acetylglucosamine transferase (SPINDLY family)